MLTMKQKNKIIAEKNNVILEILAKNKNSHTRIAVAKNKNISSEILELLVDDKSHIVRYNVANNHNANKESLEILSKDKDPIIIEAVALNPNVDQKTLSRLIRDEGRAIVRAVIANKTTNSKNLMNIIHIYYNDMHLIESVSMHKNADQKILELLSNSHFTSVRQNVVKHKNTNKRTLKKLVRDNMFEVRETVCSHTNDQLILTILANDKLSYIRGKVAENTNVSKKILDILSKDKSEAVSKAARLAKAKCLL